MNPDSAPETLAGFAERTAPPAPGGRFSACLADRGDGWRVFGVVADTHLGSRHYRPDVLRDLYDLFAAEGVTEVYHAGNWIEGESKVNRHDISVFGLSSQIRYFIEEYPSRPGIVTAYVAGDDHEGWYQQREQINIGRHLESEALAAGRTDLKYLGYIEADVMLQASPGRTCAMRVMHGGGGSSYALSYRPQKIVESLQGGEKPNVLLIGHYHKQFYATMRNVHVLLPGCTEDQSIFMRKHSIEAHVGGALVYLKQDDRDGHVTDFVPRFRSYFDRTYYSNRRFDV
jgi:predicted phosphodiesterase